MRPRPSLTVLLWAVQGCGSEVRQILRRPRGKPRPVIYVTDPRDPILFNARMPRSGKQALRIVVQYLGEPERYRLIAYGDEAVYRPLELTSRAAMLKALGCLIDDIDEKMVQAEDESGNRIVFTTDISVTDSQLQAAGLSRHT